MSYRPTHVHHVRLEGFLSGTESDLLLDGTPLDAEIAAFIPFTQMEGHHIGRHVVIKVEEGRSPLPDGFAE